MIWEERQNIENLLKEKNKIERLNDITNHFDSNEIDKLLLCIQNFIISWLTFKKKKNESNEFNVYSAQILIEALEEFESFVHDKLELEMEKAKISFELKELTEKYNRNIKHLSDTSNIESAQIQNYKKQLDESIEINKSLAKQNIDLKNKNEVNKILKFSV